MQYAGFRPPTEYYDKRLEGIDEQICVLIKKRKELSNDNPGFPTKQLIASWVEKYGLYEDFLNSLFHTLYDDEMYKPRVEPKGFVKNIRLLKTFENKEYFFTVTFVRQFKNASVVHLHVDRNKPLDSTKEAHEHYSHFNLSIEAEDIDYDCYFTSGSGSAGHTVSEFVVSPALPDDCSKYKLVFKELKEPFSKPTGLEFSM